MKKRYSIPTYAELVNPVTIDRNEYNKILVKATENDRLKTVLLSDYSFQVLLDEVIKMYLLRFDKKVKTLLDSNGMKIKQKAKLVYALKLISETTLDDICLIRDIRNKFFHGRVKNFDNPKICALCKKLSTSNRQKVTANNSYDIYYKAMVKSIKRLALLCTEVRVQLVPGKVHKIKPKVKHKRKRHCCKFTGKFAVLSALPTLAIEPKTNRKRVFRTTIADLGRNERVALFATI